MYDEYGDPSETLVMDWNEHNDHTGGADFDEREADQSAPATDTARSGARLTVTASRPRGAYRIALSPPWHRRGPLRSVLYGAPADEETIAHRWAARLCFLADPRTAYREPEAPRMYQSVDLALPGAAGHGDRDAYTYPLILRFTDPDAAEALAENLTKVAAQLRRVAPDPYGGCADCVSAPCGVCQNCAG